MKTRLSIIILVALVLIIGFSGCASSTKSTNANSEDETGTKTGKKNLVENFDITPYKTKIQLKNKSSVIPKESIGAWYDYPAGETDSDIVGKTIAGTADGYRVRVTSSDNLEDADNLKFEVYSKTNHKQIYIIFDPPFYRIEVGDFLDISSARDLKFKLNQLGYTQAIVVNAKVNVFK